MSLLLLFRPSAGAIEPAIRACVAIGIRTAVDVSSDVREQAAVTARERPLATVATELIECD